MDDKKCSDLLRKFLPEIGCRWEGFKKVRKQVCKRINGRIKELGFNDAGQYEDYISENSSELEILDDLSFITISRFYRDKGVFDIIRNTLLPEIANYALHGGYDPAVWSIGSCSREEPYTLSLIWDVEVLPVLDSPSYLKIIATEKNQFLIDRCIKAVYSKTSLKDLPEKFISGGFEVGNEKYSLRKSIKDRVCFLRQDVRKELPEGCFDLILCRNLVFTYFSEEIQRTILSMLLSKLRSGGYLVTGAHEKLPEIDHYLRQSGKCIYRKKE